MSEKTSRARTGKGISWRNLVSVALLLSMILTACGGDADEPSTSVTVSPDADTTTVPETTSTVPTTDAPANPIPIRVGYATTTSNLAVAIGVEKGYYEAAGFDVEPFIYPGGAEMNEAMAANAIDTSTPGLTPAIVGWAAGLESHGIAMIARGGARYRIWAQADLGIESIEDLVGHTIAIQKGTDSEPGFAVALEANGLDVDDVTILDIRWDDMLLALEQGQVDAALSSEPAGTNIQNALGDSVVFVSDLVEYYNNGVMLSVRDGWVEEYPGADERLLQAHIEVMNFIASNYDEAVAIAAEIAGIEEDVARSQMSLLDYSYEISDSVLADLRLVAEFLEVQGNIDEAPDTDARMGQ